MFTVCARAKGVISELARLQHDERANERPSVPTTKGALEAAELSMMLAPHKAKAMLCPTQEVRSFSTACGHRLLGFSTKIGTLFDEASSTSCSRTKPRATNERSHPKSSRHALALLLVRLTFRSFLRLRVSNGDVLDVQKSGSESRTCFCGRRPPMGPHRVGDRDLHHCRRSRGSAPHPSDAISAKACIAISHKSDQS